MVALATGRSEAELLKNVQNMIRSGNIGKLIFLYSKTDDQVFDFVKRQRVDCVVVGQSTTKDPGNAKFVNNNNHQAGYDAAAFLLQKGYEAIVYAYTDMAELVQAERYKGYAELMTSKALAAQALCVTLKDDRKSQKQLLDQLAKRSKVAFVVCDDVLAIHLQRLIKQVAADTQLAIVSFNNSVLAELASPALTSIAIFPYQLGEQAAELVLSSAAPSPQPVLVPHQIIERESTPFIV
ncbi:LacI family regulatory protein [Streptococcus equi subsp. equi]|nr:LacI family regulatory protein [Streptococcus equi subsp. equi]CRS36494.1 LacI family regulatory protein [Streptococcus equi subsp. equi]